MNSAASSPRAEPLRITDTHEPFARLFLWLALSCAAFLGGVAAVAQDSGPVVMGLSALAIAGIAWRMIRTGRENGPTLLLAAALSVTLDSLIVDFVAMNAFVSLALILIGAALVIFLRRHEIAFYAGYSAFIVVSLMLSSGPTAESLTDSAISVVGFVVSAIGLRWIRDRSMDTANRFLNLFERAPVSLWEEDYTGVGEWLNGLRKKGVTDLTAYLTENPDELFEGMSRIEVVRVNEAAAKFLEVDDPSALVGPLKPETFPDDALPSMLAQFEAIWNGIDRIAVEVSRGRTVDGNPIDGLLHWAVPRRFGRPDLSRVLVSVVDITAMNDARRDLERSLKSKDELIATVSHELRTPLTTVVGLSAELSDAFEAFTTDEVRDLLKMIADQSVEVATIVEDLLVAARAESGSLKVSLEPIDLHLEAKNTLRGLEIEQEVECRTLGVVSAVMADPGRVRQILRNLLVNARRYGAVPVRMVVFDSGNSVHVEVRDAGLPIPPEERNAVFDRYYRARQTPGVTASVGLGLTVSRELARVMGGDVWYSHDGESVFTLSLPRVAGQQMADDREGPMAS